MWNMFAVSWQEYDKKNTQKKPSHLLSSHCKWGIKPLLKSAAALENGWQQEVEKRPQLR